MNEALLDSPDELVDADRSGMLRALAGAGAQVRQSSYLADEVDLRPLAATGRPRSVVVLAAGAAALCGDVLAALPAMADTAPVVVLRDPLRLPLWVGVADLVLAVSHTGGEPGVLGALDDAVRRGAAVAGVAPEGSPLRELCGRGRAPCLPTPDGRPLRAALWGVLTPLLIAAGAAGLVTLDRAELDEAADVLDATAERCRPFTESFVNPAKTLALELGTSTPVAWGATPLAGVAARRLATQLAGCAATAAVSGMLPGGLHEHGGLLDAPAGDVADLFRDRVEDPGPRRCRVVLLRDRDEPPQLAAVVDELRRAAEDRGVPVSELAPDGTRPVSRFGSLVALGDFASAYVGLAAGVDPAGVRTGQA